jgi:hypothetical protein
MQPGTLQIDDFVKHIAALKFDRVFNPYADTCDQPIGRMRRLSAAAILSSSSAQPCAVGWSPCG